MLSPGDLDAPPGVRETEHAVSVEIDPPFATFSVTTTLANRAGRDAEAILVLPLPEGAAVHGVEIARGEAWEPASARPVEEARAVYTDVVHPQSGASRPVAAVALWPDGRDRVRLQVFPVPAGRSVRIRVRAIAPIRFSGGAYRFHYPARDGRRLTPAALSLAGGAPLEAGAPGDLVVAGDEGALLAHAAGARGAGVWITAARPIEPDPPVDVVLVVDRSASMQDGARRDATSAVVRRFLSSLPEGSRVGAVSFGRSVGDRVPLGPPRALRDWAEPASRLEAPPSGSDLGAALVAAKDLLPEGERPRHVVVLTDAHFEGTAVEAPVPAREGGLPPDVQVSALVVAACDGARVLGAIVEARDGTVRCDLDRATPGEVERAVRAVVRRGERLSIEVGPAHLDAAVRAGEQASIFVAPRRRAPSAVVVRRAGAEPARVAVREVPEARALRSPSAFVWVDGDAFARARLASGRIPAGPASGSGLAQRALPAVRAPLLGHDVLHRVMQRSYLPAVRGCFLRHAPRARAPVSLVVEGRVEEAEASELSIRGASGELEACLLERARTVVYPWASGSVRFRWPITYRPQSEPTDAHAARAPR